MSAMLTTALFASLDAPVVAVPSAWTGHFVYEQRAADGATRVHDLVLAPGRCLLSTEGDGLSDRVGCDVIARDDSLILLSRGEAGYRPGTPLLKLSREGAGIVTHWLGYAHAPAGAGAGRYFVRLWS